MTSETRIFKNYREFRKRKIKNTNGVSPEFAKAYPSFKEMNETNIACWNCLDCIYCKNCRECRGVWKGVNCFKCFRCIEIRSCKNCYDCSGITHREGLRQLVKGDPIEANMITTDVLDTSNVSIEMYLNQLTKRSFDSCSRIYIKGREYMLEKKGRSLVLTNMNTAQEVSFPTIVMVKAFINALDAFK